MTTDTQPDPGSAPGTESYRTVGDVMTSPAVWVPGDATFKDIARTLEDHHINALPVVEDGVVVGVVSVSDLMMRLVGENHGFAFVHRAALRRRHGTTARDLMTSPAVTTRPGAPVAEAARRATRSRVHMMPVVDASSSLVGVVSRVDLVATFQRPDADIEHEVAVTVVRPLVVADEGEVTSTVRDGVVTLSGTTVTSSLARRLIAAAARVPGVVDVVDDIEFDINDETYCVGP